MITLTAPHLVRSVLGGSTTTPYDKAVFSSISIDVQTRRIECNVQISSTAIPDMPAVSGRLSINVLSALLELDLNKLGIHRRITLSAGQQAAIQTIINNTQGSLESGVVTLGIIEGTQSVGA